MRKAVRSWLGNIGVGYLVLCELVLGAPLGYQAASYLINAVGTRNETRWFTGLAMAGCSLPCLIAAYGTIGKRLWAWYLSLAVGVAVLVLGISFIRSSFSPDPYNRMEGGLIFGTGLYLVMASTIGLIVALLPPVRSRYISRRAVIAPARVEGSGT